MGNYLYVALLFSLEFRFVVLMFLHVDPEFIGELAIVYCGENFFLVRIEFCIIKIVGWPLYFYIGFGIESRSVIMHFYLFSA